MAEFITLYSFIPKLGLPESAEQLINSRRIDVITKYGARVSPHSIMYKLEPGDRLKIRVRNEYREFWVVESDVNRTVTDKPRAWPSGRNGDYIHKPPQDDMDSDKVVDSIKFLLNSVSKLSDRFLESNEATKRSFEHVRQDVDDLLARLGQVEADLANWRDQQLFAGEQSLVRQPELPVKPGQEKIAIPALNLPHDGILEAYRTSPSLLQPFARACSVSGRTLSGMISEIELEVFAQGTTWIVETQDGEWLLFPRPGLVNRRSQIQSLERLFEIEDEAEPPAVLELLEPGRANVVEYGRRWYLGAKGRLGMQADPMQVSLENRLRQLESRLKAIEEAKG